jgi:hypothetical protein
MACSKKKTAMSWKPNSQNLSFGWSIHQCTISILPSMGNQLPFSSFNQLLVPPENTWFVQLFWLCERWQVEMQLYF